MVKKVQSGLTAADMGFTKMDKGNFTFQTDNLCETANIAHNLGTCPKLINVNANKQDVTGTKIMKSSAFQMRIAANGEDTIIAAISMLYREYDGTFQIHNQMVSLDASFITFKIGSLYKFQAGVEYKWVAFA